MEVWQDGSDKLHPIVLPEEGGDFFAYGKSLAALEGEKILRHVIRGHDWDRCMVAFLEYAELRGCDR